MKKIFLTLTILIVPLFLASAGNIANATVACCYSGGECAEAITAQQCRNTGGSPANAETCDPNPCGKAAAEKVTPTSVTFQDLGVENVGILPTSPIYFVKEWGRGLRLFFTFNPVSKTELELRIANKKAAETKKLEEIRPGDAEAINEALQNYQETQKRLKTRLEALRETSQNPKVEKLLDQLADRTVKHEKVFDEIAKKFEDRAEIQSAVKDTKEKIVEAAAAASKRDDPAKFASKLEKALVESQAGSLEHIRSIDLIERIQDRAPEDFKRSLERLRHDFSLKLEDDIKNVLEKENVAGVRQAVEALPGDAVRHSVILEEIRLKSEKRVAEAINKATEVLEKTLREEKNIAQKAEERIRHAEEKVNELEKRYSTTAGAPRLIKNLLVEARENLDRAREAFQDGKYGEAFGQARSAEVLARNALRLLEEEKEPEAEDLKEILAELAAKIAKHEQLLKERGLSPENNPKAYNLLAEAKKHLDFAREAFANNDLASTKLHAGHVKGYLHDLFGLIESGIRAVERVLEKPAAAPAVPAPAVSDRCELIQREIRNLKSRLISGELTEEQYKGKLDNLQKEYEKTCAQPAPAPSLQRPTETKVCTQEYNPVCGSDGRTYSNECHAKVAGAAIKYRGQCEQVRKEEPAAVTPPKIESAPERAPAAAVEPAASTEPAASATFYEVKLEADDAGFYPDPIVKVKNGATVKIHFIVRQDKVYFGGLDFRSIHFNTGTVKPGGVATVQFVAKESFEFQSWWPASNVLKATGKVVVE